MQQFGRLVEFISGFHCHNLINYGKHSSIDISLHSHNLARTMSDFIKPKPTGFIHEMESFARMKADK